MVDAVKEYDTTRWDAIPAALRALDQWVCWRYEVREGKPTKVPYTPGTDRRADTTDPATWASFVATLARYQGGHDYEGIGFVFRKGGGITGVDLDKCREAGVMAPTAVRIVNDLFSYCEVSPSGTGVHVIVLADLPPGGRRRQMPWGGGVEMYDEGRFFTMTGDVLDGAPTDVRDRQASIDTLHAALFPLKLVTPAAARAPVDLDDAALLERARRGGDGIVFSQLYDYGDLIGHDGNASGADLALCNKLMFWTGNDEERTDRLFRGSALMRDKWERDSYRLPTLARARQAEVYGGPGKKAALVRLAAAAADGEDATAGDGVVGAFPDNDTENAELLLARLGGGVRHVEALGQFYLETDGIWVPDATNSVAAAALAVGRRIKEEAISIALVADEKTAKRVIGHARSSLGARGTSAMLQQLARLDAVRVSPDVWDSCHHLIACNDGVVDLRTGVLGPHDPALLLSGKANVAWHKGGLDERRDLPHLMEYLRSSYVDRDGAPDEERINFMQRWGGYCLTGDTREQKFMLMIGKGRSGKGLWAKMLKFIMPGFWHAAAATIFLEGGEKRHATELASLHNKRVIVASEFEDDVALNTTVLKRLTGGDAITARKMRMDEFTFVPTFKPHILVNGSPRIDEGGNAIWDRMIRQDYYRKFTAEATERLPGSFEWPIDKNMEAKLESEAPAIFRWLVEGAVWWYSNLAQGGGRGLDVPASMLLSRDEMQGDQDVIAAFVAADCLPRGRGEGHEVDVVFEKWNTYRLRAREKDMPLRQFMAEMRLRGYDIVKEREGRVGLWFDTLQAKIA